MGIILIFVDGISSALWGIIYQNMLHKKRLMDIFKDFFNFRQIIKVYILVAVFLFLDFGMLIINNGLKIESGWILMIMFLKTIVFGGIEEIGWRYSFQSYLEKKVNYVLATFITFICWGGWHYLFFYIDGSISLVNTPLFLLGLLTNCFVLSALFAYSNSLWICVMTHALINSLSQVSANDRGIISVIFKNVCISMSIILFYLSRNKSHESSL